MAPKKTPSRASTPAASSSSSIHHPSTTTRQTQPSSSMSSSSSATVLSKNAADVQQVGQQMWEGYQQRTPQRVKLLDAFLAFLVVVGALQFAYCLIGGNYPFNAFLSGFSATVGQFVLAVSLRMQTNPENAAEFKTLSTERAFADFVFGSLLLHFFCVNFIN